MLPSQHWHVLLIAHPHARKTVQPSEWPSSILETFTGDVSNVGNAFSSVTTLVVGAVQHSATIRVPARSRKRHSAEQRTTEVVKTATGHGARNDRQSVRAPAQYDSITAWTKQ